LWSAITVRILLVEDHLPLAESVAQALRGSGLTVDMLHDGVAADLALSSEEYVLAILDIGLPRLAACRTFLWFSAMIAACPQRDPA
jgi:DNA-binding response OmpR family regulator